MNYASLSVLCSKWRLVGSELEEPHLAVTVGRTNRAIITELVDLNRMRVVRISGLVNYAQR